MKERIEGKELPHVMDGFFGVPAVDIITPTLLRFRNGGEKKVLISGGVRNGFAGQRASAYALLAPCEYSVDILPPVKAVARDSGFIDWAVEQADMLILTGGSHVSRRIAGDYGQNESVDVYGEPDEVRDAVELRALTKALERGISVSGVCRGLEIAAACFGVHLSRVGSLHQPIDNKPQEHVVITRACGVTDFMEGMSVKSAHHGGVQLKDANGFEGNGWRVHLIGPDERGLISEKSIVELLVGANGQAKFCQFHPEMMNGAYGQAVQAFFQG